MSARTVLHDPAIVRVARHRQVIDGVMKVADKIEQDVKSETANSKTVRPFGRMMSVVETDTGARVGTSWGPAVPVEYGTVRTPAHRILLGVAEKAGRVTFK